MADQVVVEWRGLRELSAAITDLADRRIPAAQGNLVRIAQDQAWRRAIELAPMSPEGSRYQAGGRWTHRAFKAPGELKAGIHKEYLDKIGPLVEASVISTASYSNLVEHGRSDISARGGRALVFWLGGRYHRVGFVRGVRPHPFMALSAESVRAVVSSGNFFRL